MTRDLGIAGARAIAPAAVRATKPGWRDPRLWTGILIVAVSVVGGARIVGGADDSVRVWAVARAMGAGDTVAADDLVERRVRFEDRAGLAGYFRVGGEPPVDLELNRGVGAGELLARSAVGPSASSGLVQLPLAVDRELVPPSVAAGSVVDVYVLPTGGGGCPAGCAPALEGVAVVSASSVADGFGGDGRRQLVVGVQRADASRFFELVGRADSPVLTIVRRG